MPINKDTPVATINGLSIGDSLIKLDSDEWFTWLNNNTKFRFECGSTAKFTAYKDKKGYWKAQRRWNRKLRHEHLGKSEQLNWELLQETANKLNTRDSVYFADKYSRGKGKSSTTLDCETISVLTLPIPDEIPHMELGHALGLLTELRADRDMLLKRIAKIDRLIQRLLEGE